MCWVVLYWLWNWKDGKSTTRPFWLTVFGTIIILVAGAVALIVLMAPVMMIQDLRHSETQVSTEMNKIRVEKNKVRIGMTINEVLPLVHAPINASAVVDCNKVYCAPDRIRLWQHVDGTFTLSGYWLTERVSGNLTPSQDHQQMMGGKPEEVLENFTESQTAELMRQKISAGYEWRWEYTFVNGMLTSSFTVTFGRDGRVNDISDVHVTNLRNHRA